MAGKADKRERTAGVTWHSEAARPERRAADHEPVIGSSVLASKTWPKCGSTRRRFAERKSTPKIGFETAAKMNVQRVFLTEPHDGMGFPSAPERGGPVEGSFEV